MKIQTDASNKALSAIAFQNEKSIDYFFRKHSSAEANYFILDKEMLGIVVALKH